MKSGRPKGSSRVKKDVVGAFELSEFERAFIDRVGEPGAARQVAGLRALNYYAAERKAGRSHVEAIEKAAEWLGIKERQLESRLAFISEARERDFAREYEALRGRNGTRQDSTVRALSIDEALLEAIRRWGYGDGKADAARRVTGLETALRALRKHGISEVEQTTLKPRRDRR